MLGAVPSPGRGSPKDEQHSEELPGRSCTHHSLQQMSKHLAYYLNQQVSTRTFFSPGDPCNGRRGFGCHDWGGGAIGTWWAEPRDAAEPPAGPRAAPPQRIR